MEKRVMEEGHKMDYGEVDDPNPHPDDDQIKKMLKDQKMEKPRMERPEMVDYGDDPTRNRMELPQLDQMEYGEGDDLTINMLERPDMERWEEQDREKDDDV